MSSINSAYYGIFPPYTTQQDIVAICDFENLHQSGIIDPCAMATPTAKFIPGNTASLQHFTSSLDDIFRTIRPIIGPVPARILGTNLLALLGWDFISTCALQFEGKSIQLHNHLSKVAIDDVKRRLEATPHEFTLFFDISSQQHDVFPQLSKALSETCTQETISEELCQELAASFQDISQSTHELQYIECYSELAHKPRQFLEAFNSQTDQCSFIHTREYNGTKQTLRLIFGKHCPNFTVTTCALEALHDTATVLVYNDLAADWYVATMLGYVHVVAQGSNKEEIIYNQIKLGMDARGSAIDTINSGILQDDLSTWHAFLALSTKNSCVDVLLLAQIAYAASWSIETIDSFIKYAKPRTPSTALWQHALTFIQDGTLSYKEWQYVMQCLAIASDCTSYINTLSKPYLLFQSGEYTLRFELEPAKAFRTFIDVFSRLSQHKNFVPLIEELIASRKTRIEPNHVLRCAINFQELELNYFGMLLVSSCSKEVHPEILQQFIPAMKSCSETMQPALLRLIEAVLIQHGYPLNAQERALLSNKDLFECSWAGILLKCQNTTCTRIGFQIAREKVCQLRDEFLALQLENLSLTVIHHHSLQKAHHLKALHTWFHLLPDTDLETHKTGFLLLDLCRRGDGHEARNCKIVDKILRNYNIHEYPPFHFLKFCHAYGSLNLPTLVRLATALNALQDSKVDYILIMHLGDSEVEDVRKILYDAAMRIIKDPKNPAFEKTRKFLNSFN